MKLGGRCFFMQKNLRNLDI